VYSEYKKLTDDQLSDPDEIQKTMNVVSHKPPSHFDDGNRRCGGKINRKQIAS